ncbi:MAG: hydrolase [bacterium]
MITPDTLQLDRDRAALLVIDIQTRLCTAMHPDRLQLLRRNAVTLIRAARVLGLPILVTEQYPKGMGPTLPDLREALPEGQPIQEKLHFSCCGDDGFTAALEETGRDQILVTGMETHVCVFQTARDLARAGRAVYVPQDAVISRTAENHDIGLRLLERAGATRTSTEAALFDLLQVAGTPEFKAIAPLIR